MPLFQRISDTFWGYVSPVKPKPAVTPAQEQPHKSHNTKPRTDIRDALRDRKSMSPASRVSSWSIHSPQTVSTQHTRTDTPAGKRKRVELTQPGPKTKVVKTVENSEDDLGGGTLVDVHDNGQREESVLSEIIVATRHTPQASKVKEEAGDGTLVEPDVDEEDEILETFANRSTPASARSAPTREDILSQSWPADVVPLIRHIKDRGHEPLLPSSWKFDFRYLPDGLFVDQSRSDEAYIRSLNDDGNPHATRAMAKLIEIGGKIRDKQSLDLDPEEVVKETMQRYNNWAKHDAGFALNTADLLIVHIASDRVSVPKFEAGMRTKFEQRAEKWTKTTKGTDIEVPTLYGLMASGSIVVLLAYTPDAEQYPEDIPMRLIATFDFANKDYDVWSALALAIVVCHAREVLLELKDEGIDLPMLKKTRRSEAAAKTDPDA